MADVEIKDIANEQTALLFDDWFVIQTNAGVTKKVKATNIDGVATNSKAVYDDGSSYFELITENAGSEWNSNAVESGGSYTRKYAGSATRKKHDGTTDVESYDVAVDGAAGSAITWRNVFQFDCATGKILRTASTTGSVFKWDDEHQMITSEDGTGNSNWKAGIDESNNYSNAGTGGTDRGGAALRLFYEPAVGQPSYGRLDVYEASDAAVNNGTAAKIQSQWILNEASFQVSFATTPGTLAEFPFIIRSSQNATPKQLYLGTAANDYTTFVRSLLSLQGPKYIENYISSDDTDYTNQTVTKSGLDSSATYVVWYHGNLQATGTPSIVLRDGTATQKAAINKNTVTVLESGAIGIITGSTFFDLVVSNNATLEALVWVRVL